MTDPTRLLYTVDELAATTGLSASTIRACIAGVSETYPPLRAKRVRKPGSKRSQIHITADAAREWLDAFPDA